ECVRSTVRDVQRTPRLSGVGSLLVTAPCVLCPRSLHDALPIFSVGATANDIRIGGGALYVAHDGGLAVIGVDEGPVLAPALRRRSEEHTSELQSHLNLVCRLLLAKKNEALKQKRIL